MNSAAIDEHVDCVVIWMYQAWGTALLSPESTSIGVRTGRITGRESMPRYNTDVVIVDHDLILETFG